MAMGLDSGLSLGSHSDSGPFWWPTHCSTKMDSSEEDSGRLAGHMGCHFDFLLVGGSLLVLVSLPGPSSRPLSLPVVK